MDVWCSMLDTTDNCRVGSHWANCSLLQKNKTKKKNKKIKKKERILYRREQQLDSLIAFPNSLFQFRVLLTGNETWE